jgi:hypothetical protein
MHVYGLKFFTLPLHLEDRGHSMALLSTNWLSQKNHRKHLLQKCRLLNVMVGCKRDSKSSFWCFSTRFCLHYNLTAKANGSCWGEEGSRLEMQVFLFGKFDCNAGVGMGSIWGGTGWGSLWMPGAWNFTYTIGTSNGF